MSYGCHNQPRPVANMPLEVQSGWTDENVMVNNCHREEATRLPYMIRVPFVMTTACQYTNQHAADPGCAGCKHQSNKEPS